MVSWLAGRGPYVIASLAGPQGSAKSFTADVFRSLVDPSAVSGRGMPKDERDLAVAAANNFLLTIDNASFIPEWQSDAMCRIASGSGFATRTLYTNRDEELFDSMRPQLINGITDPIEREDLRDRAVFLFAPLLADADRRDEATLRQGWDPARPRVFAGLLDLVSTALKNLPNTTLPTTPRMADFVKVGVAAGIPGFYDAYVANRDNAIARGLASDSLAMLLQRLALGHAGPWEGTALELLAWLNQEMDREAFTTGITRPPSWPRTPRVLSQQVRRLVPSLRHVGVIVELDWPLGSGAGKQRGIRIAQQKAGEAANKPAGDPA